jgi:hypothetical protein
MWSAPLWLGSIALGQAAAPTPTANKASPAWLGYLIVFILLAAVVTVSLMPSKRSHQE